MYKFLINWAFEKEYLFMLFNRNFFTGNIYYIEFFL